MVKERRGCKTRTCWCIRPGSSFLVIQSISEVVVANGRPNTNTKRGTRRQRISSVENDRGETEQGRTQPGPLEIPKTMRQTQSLVVQAVRLASTVQSSKSEASRDSQRGFDRRTGGDNDTKVSVSSTVSCRDRLAGNVEMRRGGEPGTAGEGGGPSLD